MKNPLNKALSLLMAAMIVMAFSQCKSSKKAVSPAAMGEVLIEQHCSGKDYFSDKDYFRGNAVGESLDQNVSKQKALTNARTQLAQQIELTLKNVTDAYIKSAEFNNTEDLEERFESLSREVTNQKLGGTRVICEKMTVTTDNNYKTYIAVELSGDEMAKALGQRLSDDQKLRIDFNYERFKKTFEEEMQKTEQ